MQRPCTVLPNHVQYVNVRNLALTHTCGDRIEPFRIAFCLAGMFLASLIHFSAGYTMLKPPGWDEQQLRKKQLQAEAAAKGISPSLVATPPASPLLSPAASLSQPQQQLVAMEAGGLLASSHGSPGAVTAFLAQQAPPVPSAPAAAGIAVASQPFPPAFVIDSTAAYSSVARSMAQPAVLHASPASERLDNIDGDHCSGTARDDQPFLSSAAAAHPSDAMGCSTTGRPTDASTVVRCSAAAGAVGTTLSTHVQPPAYCGATASADVSPWQRRSAAAWVTLKPIIREFRAPPIVACLIAVMVGAMPPVRNALFAGSGTLSMVGDVIKMFGDCAIPCMIMVLGATLANGPGSGKLPARVLIGVGITRLVILPLWGTAVVLGAYALGVFTPPDPVFVLVMLIQCTCPTALNVSTIANMFGNGDKEISALLFYQYLTCIVTIPLFLCLYLYIEQTHL